MAMELAIDVKDHMRDIRDGVIKPAVHYATFDVLDRAFTAMPALEGMIVAAAAMKNGKAKRTYKRRPKAEPTAPLPPDGTSIPASLPASAPDTSEVWRREREQVAARTRRQRSDKGRPRGPRTTTPEEKGEEMTDAELAASNAHDDLF